MKWMQYSAYTTTIKRTQDLTMELTYTNTTWNGIQVYARLSDGYINASQLCKAGGKRFPDWYRTEHAKILINELKDVMRKTSQQRTVQSIENKALIETSQGNPHRGNLRGTWVHPDLAIQIAQWACPKFAIRVSRWIRELMLTGSVQVDSQKKNEELNELLRQKVEEQVARATASYQKQLEEKEKELSLIKQEKTRIQTLYFSDLNWKKYANKSEIIYIISTMNYASQGLFKIGRTRNSMKYRLSGHNVSRVDGDKMVLLAEFKVHNSIAVENYIHKCLTPLRKNEDKEFYFAPYSLLKHVVSLIIIIDYMLSLRNRAAPMDPKIWLEGVEEDAFSIEEKELPALPFEATPELALNINWNPLKRREYAIHCLYRYIADIAADAAGRYIVAWKEFQEYLIKALIEDYRHSRARQTKPS